MEAYSFDAAAERDRLVAALRALAEREGFSRVVIGVSGGLDLFDCRLLIPPGKKLLSLPLSVMQHKESELCHLLCGHLHACAAVACAHRILQP